MESHRYHSRRNLQLPLAHIMTQSLTKRSATRQSSGLMRPSAAAEDVVQWKAMRKPLLLALSLLGLFDSSYLWWVYTSPSHPLVCVGTGCDIVRASSYASFLGVPTPAFGVAMYALLAILIVSESLAEARRSKPITLAITGVAAAGVLVSLILSGIEGFVLHAWCAWCVVSALTVTAILLLSTFEFLRPGARDDAPPALALVRRNFAVLVAGIAIGLPAFYFLSLHGEIPTAHAASAAVLTERLVRPDSHMTGDLNSPITVVEFADFECPYCGMAEKTVEKIRADYGNRIRFVFRHFPMTDLHPYAEKSAEASECAAAQGKFWEAAQKFYENQNDLSVPALLKSAGELGLNVSQFTLCMTSGQMAARVKRDQDDGRAVGVKSTPTFFVGQQMFVGAMDYQKFSGILNAELSAHGLPSSGPTSLASSQPPGAAAQDSNPLSLSSPNPFASASTSSATCSEDEAKLLQPTLIHTEEAHALYANGQGVLFVDVRPFAEYKAGRILGAVDIPEDEIDRRWSSLPKDRDIVFYQGGKGSGDICAASRSAGRTLLAHGYSPSHVKVFQDGLQAWRKAGFPVDPRSAALP